MSYKFSSQYGSIPNREDLATDPSTPEEVLIDLAHDPEQSVRAYLALYNDNLPKSVWKVLINDPDVRHLLVQRSDIPDYYLSTLYRVLDDQGKYIILKSPKINFQTIQNAVWVDMSEDEIEEWLKDRDTPANALLAVIRESNDFNYIHHAFSNKDKFTTGELIKLIKDDIPIASDYAIHRIMTDSWTSKELKDEVAELALEYGDATTRSNIARDKNIDHILLHLYAQDDIPGVRASVASNPSISDETLMLLLQDKDPNVVHRLIGNQKLLKDGELAKKFYSKLKKNWPTIFDRDLININWIDPKERLKLIAENAGGRSLEEYVRHEIKDSDILKDLYRTKNLEVLKGLAYNPLTPDDIYAKLFKDKRLWGILVNLRRTSPNQLVFLAKRDISVIDSAAEGGAQILSSIALNHSTPGETLAYLVDKYYYNLTLIINALRNPNSNDEVINTVFNNLEHYLESNSVLSALAGNGKLSPGQFEKLYSFSEYRGSGFKLDVNYYLANNSRTPKEIIENISEMFLDSPINLLTDAEVRLLKALASNPYSPDYIKESYYQLAKSKNLNKLKSKRVPNIDYKFKSDVTLPGNANTDLELLKRLKGYLKNA